MHSNLRAPLRENRHIYSPRPPSITPPPPSPWQSLFIPCLELCPFLGLLSDAAFLTKTTRFIASSPSACLQPFPHHHHPPVMQRQPPPRACLPACRVLCKICLLLCVPFFPFLMSTAFLPLLLVFHRDNSISLPPSSPRAWLLAVSSPCLLVGTST